MDIKLKQVRMDFADLWTPTQYKNQGAHRYNLTVLVEPGSENDKAIEAAIQFEAEQTFGKKAAAMLKSFASQKNQYCYQLAAATPEYEYRTGFKVLGAHNKLKPMVIDHLKNPLSADSGKPYRGCIVNAKVSLYAQATTGAKDGGIRCSFNGVQFWKDAPAFGGARPASLEDFELSDGADADSMV